jgi:hypothetical protein
MCLQLHTLMQGGCVGIEVTDKGEPATEHCSLQATIEGRGTFVMTGDHDYIGNTFLFSITGGSGDFLGAQHPITLSCLCDGKDDVPLA